MFEVYHNYDITPMADSILILNELFCFICVLGRAYRCGNRRLAAMMNCLVCHSAG